MIKVGVTGGIGSGKSTVCHVWEELGAFVVYADELAKKLMAEDEQLKKQIISSFGKESYHADGSLNRAFLAREAFQKGRTERLNRIVHPAVSLKVEELAEYAESQGVQLFAEEAALLLKKGRPEFFDVIVLVTADAEKRIQRVQNRDNISTDEVVSRMEHQQNFEELISLCDYVIHNNTTLDDLQEKAAELYQKILRVHISQYT